MADFTFGFSAPVDYDPVTGLATVFKPSTSGTFTVLSADAPLPGEEVTLGGNSYTYLGKTADGDMLLQIVGAPAQIILSATQLAKFAEIPVDANNVPYCLLAGTLVLTPEGQRPVETIRIGDAVLTSEGQPAVVRWVGRQRLLSSMSPHAVPVTVKAGALADGIPSRDLHVSPDHAVLLDGILVNAQALVNGDTITRMANPPERIDYFHLEFDQASIIIAENTPVESFVDNVSRVGFDNYSEWVALGLTPQPVETIPVPRAKSARQVPEATRERLAARSTISA